MEVKNGYLLISDISGYTEFLVKSELLHAKQILDTLLKTGIESIRPPIRVLNTRGDAVLSFVAADDFLQPQSLIEAIEAIYIDFRRPLERVILNTTCMCKVCANMAGLDLKLFRHFVEVATRIWDLNGVWDHRQEKRRAAISYEKAWVAESIESWAPPLMAWDYATDAEQKRDYYDMISVVRTDKTPGRVGVGLQYHCRHNLGEVTFIITNWNPPSHFVNDEIAFGIPVQFTM